MWLRAALGLVALLVAFSLPDLLSPPITPTGLRQVQTYSQTVNFIAADFSPTGLTLDIDGPRPFHVVYEFPLYQALVGLIFLIFGPSFLAGKLLSLFATIGGFWLALDIARRTWGEAIAWRAGAFFAACPIVLLVDASFQPDALALALGMVAGVALQRWRAQPDFGRWLLFLLSLLASALAKFTVLVPFLPLLAASAFHHSGRWRPLAVRELIAALLLFLTPFVAWNLYRSTLMDPRYLALDGRMFLIGDLTRFLQPGFYIKPAFIVGAMALCGAGIPLVVAGVLRLDRPLALLLAGVPLYYILLPTAADQTYYAFPLVPALALLLGRGAWLIENTAAPRVRLMVRLGIATAWLGGFAIAAPYTLRHDRVSLATAEAIRAASAPGDLLFVMNMHDRGVAIGAFNPTIITLAGRGGWNVDFHSVDPAILRPQIEARRREGARWLVATWYTPELEPWFTPLLPASFGRQPRFEGVPVDGQMLVKQLSAFYPIAQQGENFALLRLP